MFKKFQNFSFKQRKSLQAEMKNALSQKILGKWVAIYQEKGCAYLWIGFELFYRFKALLLIIN